MPASASCWPVPHMPATAAARPRQDAAQSRRCADLLPPRAVPARSQKRNPRQRRVLVQRQQPVVAFPARILPERRFIRAQQSTILPPRLITEACRQRLGAMSPAGLLSWISTAIDASGLAAHAPGSPPSPMRRGAACTAQPRQRSVRDGLSSRPATSSAPRVHRLFHLHVAIAQSRSVSRLYT